MAVVRLAWFACLSALALLGPQEPKAGKGRGDPQSSFEPRSGPGIGQKFLQKFVGDWIVEKRLYTRGPEPIRMTGACKQEMIHDGRFLRSEFTFERAGTKSTGTGIIGFESDSNRFTSVWTDSRSTRMSARQSSEPFDGTKIVLLGKSIGDEPKNARKSRTVTQWEEDGKKLVHRQYSIAADGNERLIMELVMTRKPTQH